jgi:flagellar protein FlgJ
MAISPPSDIVLDVVQAADPSRYQEAAGRLRQLAPAGAEPFGDVLEEVASKAPLPYAAEPAPQMPFDAASAITRIRSDRAQAHRAAGGDGAVEAYRGFEAMAMTTFVEAMLPQQANSVFGSGTAGQIWKSMLAQQIGAQVAQAGGIGIAAQVEGAQAARAAASDLNAAAAGAIVAGMERGFVGALMPDRGKDFGGGA